MAQHARTKKPASRKPAARREKPVHPSPMDPCYPECPIGDQQVVSPPPGDPATVRVPPQ
jgi:hypothetical protein